MTTLLSQALPAASAAAVSEAIYVPMECPCEKVPSVPGRPPLFLLHCQVLNWDRH